jgi:hypothetical protein
LVLRLKSIDPSQSETPEQKQHQRQRTGVSAPHKNSPEIKSENAASQPGEVSVDFADDLPSPGSSSAEHVFI